MFKVRCYTALFETREVIPEEWDVACGDLEGGPDNPWNLQILIKRYISSKFWVGFPPLRKILSWTTPEKKKKKKILDARLR